jgi:UDP-glucuronate decarboxylase
MIARKRVLVTGGAGFLGSHLCEDLVLAGHRVICTDNFATGQRRNIEHLLDCNTFELRHHDVLDPLDIDVDEIYNLACPASPVQYQLDPIRTTKTSVIGAINVLDLADRCGAKVLQASTSEIYGNPRVHPQPESYWGNVDTLSIRACYDEGKRCSETLFFDYWRQRSVRIKIARIFNTYGPRMHPHDGRVVSNFITQALRNEPLTLYGSGEQTRSFCYVDDLIAGLKRLMSTPDAITGPFNIGNPSEFTMRELADLVIDLTGSRSRIVMKPLPPGDPEQRKPDITLAKSVLGWQPTIEVRDGLLRTIAYFEETLQHPAIALSATINGRAQRDQATGRAAFAMPRMRAKTIPV